MRVSRNKPFLQAKTLPQPSKISIFSLFVLLAVCIGLVIQWHALSQPVDSTQDILRGAAVIPVFNAAKEQTDRTFPAESDQLRRRAAAASFAEEIIAAPNHPDFLSLRNYLTKQLVNSVSLDENPSAIPIDLQNHLARDTIQYLVDARPGILSVIFYSSLEGNDTMLVYWPELVGEQIYYKPIDNMGNLLED